MTVLPPGGTIGMLGGGQLGRMTALFARGMGYRIVVLDPVPAGPAGQVADRQIVAPYDSPRALAELTAAVDVVTLEFENLPAALLDKLAERVPVRPGAHVLRVSQDRLREKGFLRDHEFPVAPFAPLHDISMLPAALATVGLPAVIKTATLGYDGKGQQVVESEAEARSARAALGGPCILERFISFKREISVVVARDITGHAVAYEPAENVHLRGILDTSMTPARVRAGVRGQAQTIALRVAQALDLVGVLAVELFVLADDSLLINELAPRPHNSGHWSIEACLTSQFEQQVRISIGAAVGPPDLLRPAASANLLGDLWAEGEPRWERLLALPDVHLHLYGKGEPRLGRKMGHITALAAGAEAARARVLAARAALSNLSG